MRELNVEQIKDTIAEMCIEINHVLSPDMKKALNKAGQNENSELGKQTNDELPNLAFHFLQVCPFWQVLSCH